MDKAKLQEFQERLDALSQEAESIHTEWRAWYDAEEARHDAEREASHLKMKARENDLAARKSALYQIIIGKAGLDQGDVVQVNRNYDAWKQGDMAEVGKAWRDNDHDMDLIDVHGILGSSSLPIAVLDLVLDPEKIGWFRFQKAADGVNYYHGAELRRKLALIQAALTAWIESLPE